jgi:hypothetical protein
MIHFTTLGQAATEALSPPSEFPTSDPHAFTTHGCVLSFHLDSDLIDQSNWDVISRDLLDRFSGDRSDRGQPDAPDVYVSARWPPGRCA